MNSSLLFYHSTYITVILGLISIAVVNLPQKIYVLPYYRMLYVRFGTQKVHPLPQPLG
jgi:hypothetical protein